MQNFGRGMWRRVGDYERIQVPLINKNYELEKYLGLMEYIKQQRKQMTQVNKDIITNKKPFDNKKMLIEEEVNPNIDEYESINENVVNEDVVNENVVNENVVNENVVNENVVNENVVNENVVNEDVVSVVELPNIIPKKSKKKQKTAKK
jgi:hypothetical protein